MKKKMRQLIAENCRNVVSLMPNIGSDIPFNFNSNGDYRRCHEEILQSFRNAEIELGENTFSDNEEAGEVVVVVDNTPARILFDYAHGVISQMD